MTIVGLEVQNFKRLKAVSIKPDGKTVTVSGRNDQGKTSLLDAIEHALCPTRAICEMPVRQGEKFSRIVCDLGDIVIERIIEANGESKLKIRGNTTGKTPEQLRESLYSKVAFDPLSFVRMEPDKQVDTLRKLVGLDFTEINVRRRKAFDDRTLIGRQLDQAKAVLAKTPYHADAPTQPVDAQGLNLALKKAREINAAIWQRKSELESNRQQIRLHDAAIGRAVARIGELKRELDEQQATLQRTERAKGEIAKAAATLERELSTVEPDDEQTPARQLDDIALTNERVAANKRHTEQNAEVQRLDLEYNRLTCAIETCDQEKNDALEWAEFPLPGLSFSESSVLLNGVPFTQGSQARQLQAAVAIGLALNPTVRVILVRDASLLDEESMKLMAGLAEKHEAQIWLEVVNSTDPAAVVIEDGEVKTLPAPEVPAK